MEQPSYTKEYAEFLASHLNTGRNMRIVCDCGNGATGVVLPLLREQLAPQCTLSLLNTNIDPEFPAHGPDPTQDGALDALKEAVRVERADFGVAFDGDGDRAVFVDDQGAFIPSHIVLPLLCVRNAPPYVADELTYQALIHSTPGIASRFFAAPVGRKFIAQAMIEHHASVGGEISGHYYFRDFWGLDSGLLATMHLASAVSQYTDPLSQEIATYQPHDTKLIAVHTPRSWTELKENVQHQMLEDGASPETVRALDGLTADFGDSWVNLRPSNTEPVIKITAGAARAETVEKILTRYRALIG